MYKIIAREGYLLTVELFLQNHQMLLKTPYFFCAVCLCYLCVIYKYPTVRMRVVHCVVILLLSICV